MHLTRSVQPVPRESLPPLGILVSYRPGRGPRGSRRAAQQRRRAAVRTGRAAEWERVRVTVRVDRVTARPRALGPGLGLGL